MKRAERSAAEDSSYWMIVDGVLEDGVAKYGNNCTLFTSGWTGYGFFAR
jgi:hypothetical protein